MRDLTVISAALVIVEQRLCEPMNAADLAKACFFSYSGLQKLFGYAFGCSVSEYITKRRLTKASNELLASTKSITEIALEYQYDSVESFARIERELSDTMFLFRTGGDEFAVVTSFTDLTDAERLARSITSHNGTKVKANEHEIPLSLRIGISKIPENTLSYQRALSVLESAIDEARLASDYVAVYVEEEQE